MAQTIQRWLLVIAISTIFGLVAWDVLRNLVYIDAIGRPLEQVELKHTHYDPRITQKQ